jgi:uncharacterized protein (TIGR03083 family)
VDRDQIHAATARERRCIADLIDDLDEAQLATPSLCAGWDVKTVGAHLVSLLVEGTGRVTWLGMRRGGPDRAIDELARRCAERPATEIAASLRDLADSRYWRPPPQAPGLLAEVLAHSGDIRIPLGLPLDLDPESTATALDFLAGPAPIGLVPAGTGIVFDTSQAVLAWTRLGLTMGVNQFGDTEWTNNLVSFRVEERVAIGVRRPTAVCTVTGLPTA